MNQPKLGAQLAHARKGNGLTQDELAEKCGVTVRTIQRIEAGLVNPRMYTIKMLSEVLEHDFLASVNDSNLLVDEHKNPDVGSNLKMKGRLQGIFNLKHNTMRKLFILTTVLIFCAFGVYTFLSNKNVVGTDWRSDISYLASELPQKHYNFSLLNNHNKFLKELKSLGKRSTKLTDLETALGLQSIIAGLGDSHTMAKWGKYLNKDKMLPLQLYWFKDGLHIIKTTKTNKTVLGKKLTAINGMAISDISQKLSSIVTVDNNAVYKQAIPNLLPYVEVLNFLEIIKDEQIRLTLNDSLDNEFEYLIKPEYLDNLNVISIKPDETALCFKNQKSYFIDYDIENDGVYYLQYNRCWSRELEEEYRKGESASFMPSFTEFEDRVLENLKNNTFKKLVLDLRFNGGGNSYQGKQFIHKLAEHISSKQLQFYVVVGRKTSSSAIMNAIDAMGIENAIMVGEETSGSPNHFGEVRTLELPNSKLVVRYSTKYFKKVAGDAKSLIPDNYIEMSYNDFVKGRDPVYEWVIKQ